MGWISVPVTERRITISMGGAFGFLLKSSEVAVKKLGRLALIYGMDRGTCNRTANSDGRRFGAC